MKNKTRVGQENSIVEKNDKTSAAIMEIRMLPRDTENRKKGFLIGMRERSETTSLTPITRLKRVHFQFSPDRAAADLKREHIHTTQHIKSTAGVCPHEMAIFTDTGTSYT